MLLTFASEQLVWMLYPFITHLPTILLIYFVFHKRLVTAVVATFTTYLFCQPAKFAGVLVFQLSGCAAAEYLARILCLVVVGYVSLFYLTECLAEIFQKDTYSVCIFGIMPTVYYLFDYLTVVYTDLWLNNNRVVMEFLPFFLEVVYVIFCTIYYKEYEQKAEALRREQIISIAAEQRAKEMEAVRRAEQEIRILRHDMRMFLSSLAISIENGTPEKAREMIDAYISRINSTKLERFCENEIINYVLSDYAGRCAQQQVAFSWDVELTETLSDDMLFASILSNALDNALNAQILLPQKKRSIRLMLKNSGGKLLLSVKNPVGQPIPMKDGVPVARKDDHGYGTLSIRYITERLGGNCQFSLQDDVFILRVII